MVMNVGPDGQRKLRNRPGVLSTNQACGPCSAYRMQRLWRKKSCDRFWKRGYWMISIWITLDQGRRKSSASGLQKPIVGDIGCGLTHGNGKSKSKNLGNHRSRIRAGLLEPDRTRHSDPRPGQHESHHDPQLQGHIYLNLSCLVLGLRHTRGALPKEAVGGNHQEPLILQLRLRLRCDRVQGLLVI